MKKTLTIASICLFSACHICKTLKHFSNLSIIVIFQFVDLDECSLDYCEQSCNNSRGSYSCSCRQGFILSDDKQHCSGKINSHFNGAVFPMKLHVNVSSYTVERRSLAT